MLSAEVKVCQNCLMSASYDPDILHSISVLWMTSHDKLLKQGQFRNFTIY